MNTKDPKVYISGKLVEKSDAKISVFDHGLLYGDGVFEGIRAYSGRVFRLKQHVDRLYESALGIHLQIPMTREQMAAAIVDTLAFNKLIDAYIRVVVTRGAGSLGLDPRKTTDPQIIIITDHISLYPAELYEHGLKIVTAGTTRNHPNAVNPRIKSLNYLNNILARIEGTQAGCMEALMLNHKGEVAECTGDNIFIVHSGQIHTPSIDSGILEGITRDAVIELARATGYTVTERPMDRLDVFTADECFLTGTAAELIPVVECDGRVIGMGRPGPITRELRERFHRLVREEREVIEKTTVIEISSILAPTDFSTHSERALRYACQLAERLGAPLHILHVLSEIVPAGPDPLLMPVMPAQFYRENEDRARATLEQLPDPSWEKPPSVVRAVRWGSPVDSIVAYALDQRIGMIVIATHGRTGFSHVLLGSVAEHIVREAPCPVLTIRDNARTRPAAARSKE